MVNGEMEDNVDFTTIGTLVAQIDTEYLFTNADINDWIQEEFHVESIVRYGVGRFIRQ